MHWQFWDAFRNASLIDTPVRTYPHILLGIQIMDSFGVFLWDHSVDTLNRVFVATKPLRDLF